MEKENEEFKQKSEDQTSTIEQLKSENTKLKEKLKEYRQLLANID